MKAWKYGLILIIIVAITGCAVSKSPEKMSSLIEFLDMANHEMDGNWLYVILKPQVKQKDVKEICTYLKKSYPKSYFKIFSDLKSAEEFYEYDVKKTSYPKSYEKKYIGIFRPMPTEWKFQQGLGYESLAK